MVLVIIPKINQDQDPNFMIDIFGKGRFQKFWDCNFWDFLKRGGFMGFWDSNLHPFPLVFALLGTYNFAAELSW